MKPFSDLHETLLRICMKLVMSLNGPFVAFVAAIKGGKS